MTMTEAIAILKDTAASWAENMEESLTDRVFATDTDDELFVKAHEDALDFETAKQIRAVWQAVDTVRTKFHSTK